MIRLAEGPILSASSGRDAGAPHVVHEGADYDACLPGGTTSMRIKGQLDIDIFISDSGYICLKQKDEVEGEKVIEFAPAYGQKVAGAIASLQQFAQQKFEKADFVEE